MYFQAGPTFYPAPTSESVQVIAKYDDGQIAALVSSYGHGKVAVVGPHPEARESWLDEVPAAAEAWAPTTTPAVGLVRDLLSDNPVGQ